MLATTGIFGAWAIAIKTSLSGEPACQSGNDRTNTSRPPEIFGKVEAIDIVEIYSYPPVSQQTFNHQFNEQLQTIED
jgi:hypothetical protein